MNIEIVKQVNDYQIIIDNKLIGSAGKQLYGYYGILQHENGYGYSRKYNSTTEAILAVLQRYFEQEKIDFPSDYWVKV